MLNRKSLKFRLMFPLNIDQAEDRGPRAASSEICVTSRQKRLLHIAIVVYQRISPADVTLNPRSGLFRAGNACQAD